MRCELALTSKCRGMQSSSANRVRDRDGVQSRAIASFSTAVSIRLKILNTTEHAMVASLEGEKGTRFNSAGPEKDALIKEATFHRVRRGGISPWTGRALPRNSL